MARFTRLRLLGGKKLTFLYVPDDASVRQFLVPKLLVYALGAGVFAFLGLSGWFGAKYLRAAGEGRRASQILAENIQLRAKLAQHEQRMAGLEADVQANGAFQQKVSLIAGIQDPGPEVLQGGIGGPSPDPAFAGAALSPELRGRVDNLTSRLVRLSAQVRIQRTSYDEIVATLESNHEEWDHTPSVGPVGNSTLSSRFGRRMDPFTGQTAMHEGVDYAARPGSLIRATADGTVSRAERFGTYGLTIDIEHGDGMTTRYAHCMSLLAVPGQRVRRGDPIARVGSTGRSSGCHVHYEVLKNGMQVDPILYVLNGGPSVD